MAQPPESVPVHCYTNPSFCRQSEYIPDDHVNDLPPPPQQFQGSDDLPPPPPPLQLQCHVAGQSNPAFQAPPETTLDVRESRDRYCYLEGNRAPTHRRYASLPVEESRVTYNQSSRYEYIEQDEAERSQLPRRNSSRYEFIPHQQVQQRSTPATNQDDRGGPQTRTCRSNAGRYAVIPGDQNYQENNSQWSNAKSPPRHINTPQGRYVRVPLQEEIPPALPERNVQEFSVSPKNNLATQKLHEILSTPRKPRSRSEERTLSPKRQQSFNQTSTPQRRALTPGGSPNGRTFSPTRTTPQNTPQRAFSSIGPQTSTPNKESSARRCLPLLENSSRQQDLCPANNCGRLRYVGTAPVDLMNMSHEPPPRYAYTESGLESMPMMSGSPKYQMVPADKKNYQSVESAFLARTAVVPPLSPPNSDANTTLASGMEKSDRKSAPILLILVGLLTCGLALYLSWSQGRRYYFDSAVGCGACCALAGACRSLRRTWTGLGLAGLSALSCAGLLLLAAKSPKDGTPLHDITAGALCGVSVLGAALALLALLKPKCNLGRHRRVHSWIPRFSP
ncbi:hypothetical protein ALC60_12183 [Trachymyrmex zeteki]|uniref:Transmembrane protein n=1 Tax=Mycetomoellerius zeteki TaxID=64791 RepID=A0A151WLE1_9HYME|nr:PREDICTED: uncharacterized protein LOC108728744 [Trachymyrmex zeteki]XP_018312989.1 PREDICTED: uncharacterized protein LOC108728744 [Trachymyrmex zeteki]XP_018312990.1 PREDICTED: uncharacterized protein LOC108728744 [Trachymyrmex zeteki]XP_018312991.1 PREDICTED: uncharacterized protein LOC108728744 [Trachymyrmex zeteki]KYQ48678.1 hypothetical protein ALC60_12183 [Trachymyrmex zeteki]